MLVDEKRVPSVEELEAQAAFELPERELPALIKVILVTGDVIPVRVRLRDVNVFLQLCAVLIAAGVVQKCSQRG